MRNAEGKQCEEELLTHAVILDSLFLRYSAESVAAKTAEAKTIFCKLALNCQQTYTRTVIAVAGLNQQRAGNGSIRADD